MSVPTAPIPPPLPVVNTVNEPIKMGENLESTIIKDVLAQSMDIVLAHRDSLTSTSDQNWVLCNVNVEPKLQGNAPRCGPVSLSMAAEMALLSKQHKQSSGNLPKFTKYEGIESELTDLVNLAKRLSFTSQGEMFSASNLSVLAKEFYGLEVKVTVCGLDNFDMIVSHLVAGNPILVPYDASPNYSPCLVHGHKAHWAVLTGFLCTFDDNTYNWEKLQKTSTISTLKIDEARTYIHTLQNPRSTDLPKNVIPSSFHLLAKQPKSRHVAVWPWKDLNDSNGNLLEYNPDKESAKNYVFPKGGLCEGLCKKVIYLWKS